MTGGLWYEALSEDDRPVYIHAVPSNPMMPPVAAMVDAWKDRIPTSSFRWKVEALVSGAIGHANGLWMVGKPLDGMPLSQWLEDYPEGVPWRKAQPLLNEALLALKASRAAKAAHPGLSPASFWITNDGEVLLTEFVPHSAMVTEGGEGDEGATMVWQGDLDFCPPELLTQPTLRGKESSDIFCFALLAYRLLTGEMPFGDGVSSAAEFVQRWSDPDKVSMNSRNPIFVKLEGLRAILGRALSVDPSARYQDFDEIARDFEDVKQKVFHFSDDEIYLVEGVLGRGGFGEVFQGRRERDGQIFAIKQLMSDEFAERFILEAKVLKSHAHKHIVRYENLHLLADSSGREQYYLVMEFLPEMEASLLRTRIRGSQGGLDPAEVLPMFQGFLEALKHLHEHPQPILHRDIKPGNLYCPAGQPEEARIFDLGIAKDVTGDMTTGLIPGTLEYMSPEFASTDGMRGTAQSDIFAMGYALHEALTGTTPWERLSKNMNKAYSEFIRRSREPQEIDFSYTAYQNQPGLIRVVALALARLPERRYPSAAAMLRDLNAVIEGGQTETAQSVISEVCGNETVLSKGLREASSEMDETRIVNLSDVVSAAARPEISEPKPSSGKLPLVVGGIVLLLIALGILLFL